MNRNLSFSFVFKIRSLDFFYMKLDYFFSQKVLNYPDKIESEITDVSSPNLFIGSGVWNEDK